LIELTYKGDAKEISAKAHEILQETRNYA
jgi:hypothetical protein